jgi:hypothetical protein
MVAQWVDNPKDKPITCSFLKLNVVKRDEVKFTFDVSRCDKLFHILLKGGVIKLSEGHVVPSVEQLGWRKYYKWHYSNSHTANECIYFRWHVQSALNDGRLTLGDGGQMKLDVDLFLVDMVDFSDKKVLVCAMRAEMTRGKNMVIFDELRSRMLTTPRSPNSQPQVGRVKEEHRTETGS